MPNSTQEVSATIPSIDQEGPLRAAASRQAAKSLPRVLQNILALDDFEEPARRRIPRPIFGYVAGASETNASLRGNRAAFDDLAFVPRVLKDVSVRTQKTTLFGRTYDAPFGIAPMGGSSMAAYQGDIALARVAAAANIPMILSGASLSPMEQVAEVGHTAWFQAYFPGDAALIAQLVDRVARAGYDTLCMTADTAVAGNRENNVRSGFHKPLRPTLRLALDGIVRPRWLFGMFARTLLLHGMPHIENMCGPRTPILSRTEERPAGQRDKLCWAHVELVRRLWKGRLIIKGILAKDDARIARESGVDGIIVSNHGGRQLDGSASPLRVLPGIVSQAGEMVVMIDSGFRRGTDVLKALALGAKFVFLGRPFLYAVAIAGDAGAQHLIKLLRDEIDRDMALLGIATLAEMQRERLMITRSFADFGAPKL